VLGQLELQRHLRPYPKGDVRYVSTIEESIADVKAVTLDDAKKFYTDFYGASNGEFSVVGDFDAPEISKLASELFGSWKSPRPFVRVGDTYRDVSAIDKSLETPDKANAVFVAGINLNVQDTDPDYAALVLGNYMLGGGFLNSRSRRACGRRRGSATGSPRSSRRAPSTGPASS
jgi:zinc protease